MRINDTESSNGLRKAHYDRPQWSAEMTSLRQPGHGQSVALPGPGFLPTPPGAAKLLCGPVTRNNEANVKSLARTVVFAASLFAAAHAFAEPQDADILLDVAAGAQAVALSGKPLVAPPADPETRAKLEAAIADYNRDPGDADNIIWYGRRLAYAGDYREAIRVFSEGIARHPEDARMYRHRGHRYISIREIDRAIGDLEHAAKLIEGTADEIEPDGLPNALNIPVSTLHGNIRRLGIIRRHRRGGGPRGAGPRPVTARTSYTGSVPWRAGCVSLTSSGRMPLALPPGGCAAERRRQSVRLLRHGLRGRGER